MIDSAIIFLIISLFVVLIGIMIVYTFHVPTIDRFKLLYHILVVHLYC